MRIAGAVCLVTGASSGIGRATAIALSRRGAKVAICARRKDKLDETLAACRARDGAALAVTCDVTDPDAVRATVEQVERTLGPVDVLVANAGVGRYLPFSEETLDSIERQVRTNLLGQMLCAREVLPGMQRRRRGHLVFLSSTNGRIPPPLQSVYNATKFATVGFAESLAYEVEPFGIGVTIVYPGAIQTEFFDAPEFARMRTPKKLSPEKVAEGIVRGIEHNRIDVSVPASLRIPAKMRALFPGLVRRGVRNYAKAALPKP